MTCSISCIVGCDHCREPNGLITTVEQVKAIKKKSHVAIKYLGDCVITGQVSTPPVQNFEYHGRESTPRERVKLDTRRPRDSRRSNTGIKHPKA
jgi:hypothetical protein